MNRHWFEATPNKLAVARIVKGAARLRSRMFAELQRHYLFEDRFGRPGNGNGNGKAEGLVGYVWRHFMTRCRWRQVSKP